MTASIREIFDAINVGNIEAAEELFSALPAQLAGTAMAHAALARIRGRQDRFSEAWQALDRASELGGDPVAILRVTTQLQEEQKDNDGLLESLPRLISQFPENPQLWIRLAKAQIATGLLSEAEEALATARKLGGPEPGILSLLALVYTAQGNFQALIHARKSLIAVRPNQSGPYLALAAALLAADDLQGALDANTTAQGFAEDKLGPLRQRVAILERSADKEALVQTLNELAGMNPGQLDHQIYLARKQAQAGLGAIALQTALGIIASWPAEGNAYELALNMANQPSAIITVLQKALDNLEDAPRFASLMFKLAHLPVGESDRLIDAYCEKWPKDMAPRFGRGKPEEVPLAWDELLQIFLSASVEGKQQALQRLEPWLAQSPPPPTSQPRELAREVIAALPEPHELRRSLIVDGGQEVVISPPGDSGVTVLVFCGLAQRAGYDISIIDRIMARNGASAVYLRDLRLMYFLGGIRTLGPDRASMVAALRTLLAQLNTRKLVVIISSAGGLGGLPVALELGASRIVSMASPSGFTQSIFDDLGLGFDVAPMVDRISGAFPAEDTDNLPKLQALTTPPDLWMCYGADSVFDRMQAERLQAIDGVTLSPIAGWADHNIAPAMMADGSLEDLLFS